MAFSRLVRFLTREDGRIRIGDAVLPSGTDDARAATHAYEITGDVFGSHTVTNRLWTIERLLCPLEMQQVGVLRCLGLNYAQHAVESKMPLPTYPVLFYKPSTALSGPTDDVIVPRHMEEDPGFNDYEVELVVVMGKAARDVSPSDALSYVAGYCVGNDVSNRDWQIKRGGGQWSHGKSPDGWAPIGPAIVSASLVKDPNSLRLSTQINGKTVQDSSTADQVFNVADTISYLSRGVTLLPGSIIMTGTPQGVGMGFSPPQYLKHGDVVTTSIEKLGSITNKIVFESKMASHRL